MKIILVAINAKFIHTNLAVRSLRQCFLNEEEKPLICEVTINDHLDTIVQKLVKLNGDAYGFSCYIWNISLVRRLAEMLKKIKPNCVLFAGGPEVSYDSSKVFNDIPWLDYVFTGEAELNIVPFQNFLNGTQKLLPTGIVSREHKNTIFQVVDPLSKIPFPYSDHEIKSLKNKIIYYESIRGCPFSCSYCLSSTIQKVRFLPLGRVQNELSLFASLNVKQIKFVDRTFNVDKKRCKDILKLLSNFDTVTNFHFEISGDLLDEEILQIIRESPKGRFQFEVGIQSTNDTTLEAISRKTDTNQVCTNIKKMISYHKAHVHVDLIAGLPFEDYFSFAHSFNDVYFLHANMLQLGFLKLLKGTQIRKQAPKYDYCYKSFPPYEVISNRFVTSKELLQLKKIEILVDGLINTNRFLYTLKWILEINNAMSPFHFFEKLSHFATEKNFFNQSPSMNDWFMLINDFLIEEKCGNLSAHLGNEFLKFDYLNLGFRHLPDFLENISPTSKQIHHILRDEVLVNRFLPALSKESIKKRYQKITFQIFYDLAETMGKNRGSIAAFLDSRVIWMEEIMSDTQEK
ncbi:MAG: DUF4080 domain-containing protein [Eubacteriaceae bacterium]|nr:DUF4080 domain-containing protein [Eubacteriaceae bacterium]MDD4507695.1 DUF4080 domain-containing protein [Eubacteriaceae bacterium]